jgi:cardiolipin synthase
MERLIETIVELVSDCPPAKIEQLAQSIERLARPQNEKSLEDWSANSRAKAAVAKVVGAWRDTDVSPAELAGMVKAAGAAYNHAKGEQEIELVWTGPSSHLIATRRTEQALLEVIDAAKERLFITSFVVYDIASIVKALNEAARRGVHISILLEASSAQGGGVSIDGIARMKSALPAAKLLSWIDRTGDFAGGKVHAKVAVADARLCFISSANLTGHAMEKNMEAGVLIRGSAIPSRLQSHLEALETTNVVSSV